MGRGADRTIGLKRTRQLGEGGNRTVWGLAHLEAWRSLSVTTHSLDMVVQAALHTRKVDGVLLLDPITVCRPYVLSCRLHRGCKAARGVPSWATWAIRTTTRVSTGASVGMGVGEGLADDGTRSIGGRTAATPHFRSEPRVRVRVAITKSVAAAIAVTLVPAGQVLEIGRARDDEAGET